MKYILENTGETNLSALDRYLYHIYSIQSKITECEVLRLVDDVSKNTDDYKNVKNHTDSFGLVDGEYTIDYNDEKIVVKKEHINYYSTPDSYEKCYRLEITISAEKWEYLKKDSFEFVDYNLRLVNGIPLKIYTCGYWSKLKDIRKRHFDSIFIPKKDKKIIINSLKDLINKEMYKKREKLSIPHKKIFLLYGPPGTGKTSIAKAIATYLEWGILQIPMDSDLNGTDLIIGINRLPKKYIILMEDIDIYFTDRKSNGKHSINFSDLLNILDGINSPNNFVVVLTTNHINNLDQALLRPGRMDCSINVSYIKKREDNEMFKAFFPSKCDKFDSFWKKIKNKQLITGSHLHNYFSYCFKKKDFMKNIEMINLEEKCLTMYT